jgi:hypothetical protein
MKRLLAVLLCVAIPGCAFAADNGYNVTYDGGSLPNSKAGTTVKLFVEPTQIRFVDEKTKKDIVVVPATSVTELSYGQDVHRRVGTAIGLAVISLGIGALMMFSKSKKHFVGITWINGDQKGGLSMQCDKNEYRGILTGIEGITGKKAIDSDAMTVKN